MLTSNSFNAINTDFVQIFETAELNRKAQLLRVVSLILGLLSRTGVVLEIVTLFAISEASYNILVTILAAALYAVCYRLAQDTRYYQIASRLLVGACTFVIVSLFISAGTTMPLVILLLPIALAINLLTTRAALIIIGICLLTGIATTFAQNIIQFYNPAVSTSLETGITYIFFLAAVIPTLIALLWIPGRKQAQTLVEQNNQLRAVLDQLQFRQEANHQISQEVLQLSQTLKINASVQADSSLTQVSLVTQLTSSTTEFSEVAGQIASATQHFSGTIETVTTGTQEIEQTANQAVEQSQEGIVAVTRTQEASREVGQFYQALLNSLASLTSQSNNMRIILSLVRSLAQETHLLSLNAAIEAVGAGEHGERFNIIAQEVKSLADRSNQANQEVIGIVNQLEDGIQQAAKLAEDGYAKAALMEQSVGDAGKVIEIMQNIIERTQNQALEINHKMLNARDQINTIRVATSQQQSTTRQVLQTLRELYSVAEQVAEGSQLVSRSALSLENTSQGLKPAYN